MSNEDHAVHVFPFLQIYLMSCLCLVVDCDAYQWGQVVEKESEAVFDFFIDAIIAISNAHLSFHSHNRVALYAFNSPLANPLLYSSLVVSSALLLECLDIMRFKRDTGCSGGRMLIINMSQIGHVRALMNNCFASHTHNIIIDSVDIYASNPILQQAADITGGTCINLEKPYQIFGKVMSMYLNNRNIFTTADPQIIDYRASCYCHGTPISIGLVCSVCLCIQCEFAPICPLCGTLFNIVGRRARKRRREEV